MTRLAASGFATAFALTMLGGLAISDLKQQPEAVARAANVTEHADPTRVGRCRIQFEGLAEDRQPTDMECEHTHWVAQRWGGRVMEMTGQGLVERGAYNGRNDFTGVPSSELPRAGWCRAWIDGRAAEDQPEQSDCRRAERVAAAEGGRVLFMPG